MLEQTKVQKFNPGASNWSKVRERISEIEKMCFPGESFIEEHLKKIFQNEKSIIFLLLREEEIIGFTCGVPNPDLDKTLHIDRTEIIPDEQGKGFVGVLMDYLEKESLNRGFRYITRNSSVSNGYAEKVLKKYNKSIIETYKKDSPYGKQVFFKIDLTLL